MRLPRGLLIVVLIVATMLIGHDTDARKKRKPAIPVSTCPATLDVPNRTYRLTQNLECSGGGISVTADNIKLDLGGHTIEGTGTHPGEGVHFLTDSLDVGRVQNGRIIRFDTGVKASGATLQTAGRITLSRVSLLANRGPGAEIYSPATITRSRAISNGSTGFAVSGDNVLIDRSVANSNAGDGMIVAGYPVRIKRSEATANGDNGIETTELGALIHRNVADANGWTTLAGDSIGMGISAASSLGNPATGRNSANGNDGWDCSPVTLC
jgi:hypothetical protein